MRQIGELGERGWTFEIHMMHSYFWYVNASHNTWGDAEGKNESLNEAIKIMFKQARKLEGARLNEKV